MQMKMPLLECDEDGHGLLNNSCEGNTVIISCSLAWLTTPSVISASPLEDLRFLTWMRVVPGGALPNIWPPGLTPGAAGFCRYHQQHPQRMPNWNSNEQREKYIGTQATGGNQSCLCNKKVSDYRSSGCVCERLRAAVRRCCLIRS